MRRPLPAALGLFALPDDGSVLITFTGPDVDDDDAGREPVRARPTFAG